MEDDRLKQAGGGQYFERLLAQIRDIRSSERFFFGAKCSTSTPPVSPGDPCGIKMPISHFAKHSG